MSESAAASLWRRKLDVSETAPAAPSTTAAEDDDDPDDDASLGSDNIFTGEEEKKGGGHDWQKSMGRRRSSDKPLDVAGLAEIIAAAAEVSDDDDDDVDLSRGRNKKSSAVGLGRMGSATSTGIATIEESGDTLETSGTTISSDASSPDEDDQKPAKLLLSITGNMDGSFRQRRPKGRVSFQETPDNGAKNGQGMANNNQYNGERQRVKFKLEEAQSSPTAPEVGTSQPESAVEIRDQRGGDWFSLFLVGIVWALVPLLFNGNLITTFVELWQKLTE